MNAVELKAIVRAKVNELYPDYDSAAFSISGQEDPTGSYIDRLLESCVAQLIQDAPLERLLSIEARWLVVYPGASFNIMIPIPDKGDSVKVVGYDSTNSNASVSLDRSSKTHCVLTISVGQYSLPCGVRNIRLSNGMFFREVADGVDACTGQAYSADFQTSNSFSDYVVSRHSDYTEVTLPDDYARFASAKMSESPFVINSLSAFESDLYRQQFTRARNGGQRPLVFQPTRRQIQLFPPVERVDWLRYIPMYKPQEVPPVLTDSYTWLCASQVLSVIDSAAAGRALEYYKGSF